MEKKIPSTNKLTFVCDWICHKITIISAVLLFLMVILAGITIFFRYVLNRPVLGGGDLLLTSFVWVALLGASVAFRRAEHVKVDSVIKMLPERLGRQVSTIAQAAIVFLCGYLVVEGVKLSLNTTDALWGGLELPATIFYLAFPVSLFLMVLYGVDDILRRIKQFNAGSKNEED